ncbi:MAG: hypothetical protein QOI73_865 [Solirubrobacteraceae bacterium]|nr:hypothetical protein [Solirubrobacteraceae bacterium]
MSPVVIPPTTPADRESHILDGLSFTDGAVFDLAEAPVLTIGALRLDWIGGIDTDGSIPLDEGHTDNATLLLPLRATRQSSPDMALHKAGLLISKLEATRQRGGLVDLWTPKGATDTWEWTVRNGEIVDVPMDSRGELAGYLINAPRFGVLLTGDPFVYRQGELIEYDEVTSSEPVFSILLEDVPGHVDAEATVTVTDTAGQPRRHLEGGMGLDGTLLIDSAALDVTVGRFAATANSRTGNYATGTVRATLAPETQAICGTGALSHVGVYRPKARVWASSGDVRLRFAYRTGDASYSYTPWVTPPVEDDFCEVPLGVITIGKVTTGDQAWDGRIEAYSTIGDTLDVDYLLILPAERSWSAAAVNSGAAGLIGGRDDMSGRTAAATLGGTAAQIGGSWATSGSTTDFAAADAPGTDETVSRSAVSDSGTGRFAVLSTVYTDCDAQIAFSSTAATARAQGVIVRWTDANNYLRVVYDRQSRRTVGIQAIVAGVPIVLGTLMSVADASVAAGFANAFHTVRVAVAASGQGTAYLMNAAGTVLKTKTFYSAHLATGGALEDGKAGFIDYQSTVGANTRYYKGFSASTPPAEPLIVNANRSIKIRHDSCERESIDGLTWGIVSPRGGRVFVPCAGNAGRDTLLWGKLRRNNIDASSDAYIADEAAMSVALRPRYRLPTMP